MLNAPGAIYSTATATVLKIRSTHRLRARYDHGIKKIMAGFSDLSFRGYEQRGDGRY